MGKKDIVYWLINAVGIIVFLHYRRSIVKEKKEVKKLKSFLAFLEQIFYEYTVYQNVEATFQSCMEKAEHNLPKTIKEVYEEGCFGEGEELRKYKKKDFFVFYYHFLMYSYLAMEYGDSIEDSTYLKNISFLKKQIFLWILNWEKIQHDFAGLIYLILIPVQLLKVIEVWGVYNLSDLSRYYDGSYGVVTRYAIVLITLLCFQITMWLRRDYSVHFYESRRLTEAVKNPFVERYYSWWLKHWTKKAKKRIRILQISSSRLKLQEFCFIHDVLFLSSLGLNVVMLYPMLFIGLYAPLIIVVASFLLSFILARIPEWYLEIRTYLMKKQKEDECYLFYGLFRMIVAEGYGDVDEILNVLELGSDIFEPVLQVCMDEYSYDNEEALEHGKSLAPFGLFMKLLDVLKVSEITGLEQAMTPLLLELENYAERRKQENEISAVNRGALGTFAAFIPAIAVIGLYLIVPFVLESLVQLEVYVKQIVF
ncbi:hypothetical protein [[Clostridium] polysaccharolyticum]|uniref:hypothetical protein n=1 Tax=[Clostridium] polysaccharolyticum TaxID=29364 RepID=UPI000B855D18|nr:hypothetical protein [[Clostridium] polysaccharolyticum]